MVKQLVATETFQSMQCKTVQKEKQLDRKHLMALNLINKRSKMGKLIG